MIDVAKKKLPAPAIGVIVYISYCAMSWFSTRGSLAYIGEQYGLPAWLANDAWAFFIGGLVPFLLYWVLSKVLFRTLSVRTGGDVSSIKYGLNYAVIAANVVLFALKFMYIALPLYAAVIDIIIDPVVTLTFVSLYLLYAFYQNYVDRSRYKAVLIQVMGAFLLLYGVLAVVGMSVAVA